MKHNNQTIRCTVFNCRYNDQSTRMCNLKEIIVSNYKGDSPKDTTICDSFKER